MEGNIFVPLDLEIDKEISRMETLASERERGINDIAKQLQEIKDIFVEVSTLIKEQGESIKQVDTNVVRTAVTTKSALKDLQDCS